MDGLISADSRHSVCHTKRTPACLPAFNLTINKRINI